MEPLIVGQTEFLADYHAIAKDPLTDQEILADVVKQLSNQVANGLTNLTYLLPAQKVKGQADIEFPFTSEFHAEDLEATVSTTFVYRGELLDQSFRSEEQK